jgi:MarR family transcriptional regulator, 2-MHQ and catechol-resistance regulon repressor
MRRTMSLLPGDPLAHRALDSLLRAESSVRRRLISDLRAHAREAGGSDEGLSASGFSVLVVLTTAGGTLELKTLRRRLGWSKANATEVTATLAARGLVERRRVPEDRRIVVVVLTAEGHALVDRLFPAHADRVTRAFGALDDGEKRALSAICRKLAA